MLTDGRGVPMGIAIAGANAHDQKLLEATLCSIPRPYEENFLPTGFDVTTLDHLVEGVSQRVYPRIPTGVGMCLYIRRALIDEIRLADFAPRSGRVRSVAAGLIEASGPQGVLGELCWFAGIS